MQPKIAISEETLVCTTSTEPKQSRTVLDIRQYRYHTQKKYQKVNGIAAVETEVLVQYKFCMAVPWPPKKMTGCTWRSMRATAAALHVLCPQATLAAIVCNSHQMGW